MNQDLDILQKTIINEIFNFFQIEQDEEDDNEISKILNFNKFLCENIGWNCYEEINKILIDMKKMSIYYKIMSLFYKD